MAHINRAPKQWCLSKTETINSFENWRQNLLYTLSLDRNFAQFLAEGATWLKKSRNNPLRGFTDDGEDVPEVQRRSAVQKVNMLDLMLGQIANFCPIISRSTIVKGSTSVEFIWHAIRLHFGFQVTGAHFIDFANIRLEPDERPEDLYQRLMAFVEDSLLKSNVLSHHGEPILEDEEMSPTLENFVVLQWLQLINPELPKLVKQRYGTELRSRTLASIKPEISQAMSSLLDEITTAGDAKIMRTSAFNLRRARQLNIPSGRNKFQPSVSPRVKSCPLCKQAGRKDFTHFLSQCKYLPDTDRVYMAKARQVVSILDNDYIDDQEDTCPMPDEDTDPQTEHSSLRIQVRQSPYIDTFYQHHPARITIDSGATGNMIRHSTAKRLGAKVLASSQSAHQADGSSPLHVVGETRLVFTRGSHKFHFEGLIVENLDVDILAGTPFMEVNDVTVRPAKRLVILSDETTFMYGSSVTPPNNKAVRRATVLRAPPTSTTVWPGEFLELTLPDDVPSDAEYALEPRTDAPSVRTSKVSQLWPSPDIMSSVAGKIRIPNLSNEPRVVKRNEHLCQISPVFVPVTDDDPASNDEIQAVPTPSEVPKSNLLHSSKVNLDPDNLLTSQVTAQFRALLEEYDSVFDPNIKGYNGAVGPFEAKVNMGPVEPPQRKGRLPQYARGKLVEVQEKFDELERMGVFMRPEDVGITVEYLNPSFLVKKSSGGSRLVTAFADVGRYSKPQPSLMPDVDSTLRQIAQWKHIIASDLTNAFYQIPLSNDSLKYCGVSTPFRGVRVYVRSAMGMPGSETALEELMCRVLGDLLLEGTVAKIADDLYCGGNTPNELLKNWRKVLSALYNCNLCLSASKTTINPRSTTILGWRWSMGTLQASPHRISTLTSCTPPEKVGGMKSFIGAYKVLARVIPRCSSLISPLDDAVTGRQSHEEILWTNELTDAFNTARAALSSNRTITLPRPDDQLWIVTDGSVKKSGIGATLYITRANKLHLAGFFSAKLRGRQITWLPCEIEALAIATATKHFSPYIVQSHNKACILTDSKPCVQAYEKLCRGEFSASPRVSTFLSTVSRYQASVRHVAGSAILPSDFASRNAPDCEDLSCQVCSFVQRTEDSVVLRISMQDLLSGDTKLPFTSRSAWLSIQSDCADLRRTHAHLSQGTRPSKKLTNVRDIKRYLNVVSIARDGLLIVKRNEPLTPTRECIVVPRQVVDGLLTALHIKLCHPSSHQMKMVVRRYLFALDLDKAIDHISESCHHCASLRQTPHTRIEQSTSAPPDAVGVSFAADIVKRARQFILVLRECVTSYTSTLLVDNERHTTLRDALIRLCIELRPLDGPHAIIRTDPGPGFKALVNDELLHHHRITLEVGRVKNPNKNPVAEKAIQELEIELLRQDPLGGPVSPVTLSIATACLNSRIRTRGLSAREMLTQRDQFSNNQIPLVDQELILTQHDQRITNHPHSEQSKAPRSKLSNSKSIEVGDLVYLYTDRNKTCARDRYLVTSVEGIWCNVKKFVGSQLRKTSYRVKMNECYKVPAIGVDRSLDRSQQSRLYDFTGDEEEPEYQPPSPPQPPNIPSEISTPALSDVSTLIDPAIEEDTSTHSFRDDRTLACGVPRRSGRLCRPPLHLEDYVTDV